MLQGNVESGHGRGEHLQQILDRSWLLPSAATKTTTVFETDGVLRTGQAQGAGCFHVIRDDLLHPVMGGNKLRKLDALIPILQAHGVTDVVSLPSNVALLFLLHFEYAFTEWVAGGNS